MAREEGSPENGLTVLHKHAPAGHLDAEEEAKWVEMPIEHVRWILAQKPENHPTSSIEDYELYRTRDPVRITSLFASLRESHDKFFEYQARIRGEFERDGRVPVPEESLGPRDDWQEEIDAIWARAKEDYAREHPCDSDTESDKEHGMDADHDASEPSHCDP